MFSHAANELSAGMPNAISGRVGNGLLGMGWGRDAILPASVLSVFDSRIVQETLSLRARDCAGDGGDQARTSPSIRQAAAHCYAVALNSDSGNLGLPGSMPYSFSSRVFAGFPSLVERLLHFLQPWACSGPAFGPLVVADECSSLPGH